MIIEPNTILVRMVLWNLLIKKSDTITVEPIDNRIRLHPCLNGDMEPIDNRIQLHPCSNGVVEHIDNRTGHQSCSNGAVEPINYRTQCHHWPNSDVEPIDYRTHYHPILVGIVLWSLLILHQPWSAL